MGYYTLSPSTCPDSRHLRRVSPSRRDFSFNVERSRRDCIVLCLSTHGASSPACSVFAPLLRFPALALLCAGVAAHCRAATRPDAGSRRASATLSLPGCASVAAHDGGRGPAVRGSCGGTQLLRVVQGRCVGCSAGLVARSRGRCRTIRPSSVSNPLYQGAGHP